MAEAVEIAPETAQNADVVQNQQDALPPEADSDDQNTEPSGEQPEKPAESTEQQEARKQSKFQRRLERQKTARIQAETEARLLREQNAKLEAQLRQRSSDEGSKAPKREDFESYEDYLDARSDWRDEQRRAKDQPQRQAQEQPKRDDPQAAIAADWTKRETAFKATARDYEDVVEPFVTEDIGAFSDLARRHIVESDHGPRLLYYLAKNEAEAERIADLKPARQVAALAEIEDKIASQPERRQSNAPPPIKPVTPSKSATPNITGNESQAEYEAKRKAMGAGWAR
jgi:hypothetical protein